MEYSKSFYWGINRASDHSVSSYADRDWKNAKEISFVDCVSILYKDFSNHFGDNKINYVVTGHDDSGKGVYLVVYLSLDPDTINFDYFVSESCIHDGTLMFEYEAVYKVVSKIIQGASYNKEKRPPENNDIIYYQVGNLIVLNEYDGDWVPKEKPWLRQRTTVLLPVKMWYK